MEYNDSVYAGGTNAMCLNVARKNCRLQNNVSKQCAQKRLDIERN